MFKYCNSQSTQKAWNHAKKKTKRYQEQDQAKVEEYLKAIENIPAEKIAYVDETGIDSCLYREYGRSKRGKKLYSKISGRKYRRTSIVAAQIAKRTIAPLQYSGTMNGNLFENWFESMLLPALPEGSVIVMDNASFHKKSRLIRIAQNKGFKLIFLPPYSPELNPIENFWSWLKRRLRKILPLFDSFDDALDSCFQVE